MESIQNNNGSFEIIFSCDNVHILANVSSKVYLSHLDKYNQERLVPAKIKSRLV
jgi:hypothetical protein